MIISTNTVRQISTPIHEKIRTTIQQAKDLPQSIKAIYKKPTVNIILNMGKTKCFLPQIRNKISALVQSGKREEIKGIQIGNRKLNCLYLQIT